MRTAACAIALLLTAAPATACNLEAVLGGQCPAMDAEQELLDLGSAVRAVYMTRLLWSKAARFQGADAIFLRACIYEKPVAFAGNFQASHHDLSRKQAQLRRLAQRVDRAIMDWTGTTRRIGQYTERSDLKISIYSEGSKARLCESEPDSEIRIALNTSRTTSYTLVGADALRPRNAGKATMSLAGGRRGAAPSQYVVSHELGHALGFLEEMAHADWSTCAAAFDIETYIREAPMPSDATTDDEKRAFVRQGIIDLASHLNEKEELRGSDTFDTDSVMMYLINRKFFRGDGAFKTRCARTRLSESVTEIDRNTFRDAYGVIE